MGIPSAMATLEDDQPSGFKDTRLSDKPRYFGIYTLAQYDSSRYDSGFNERRIP